MRVMTVKLAVSRAFPDLARSLQTSRASPPDGPAGAKTGRKIMFRTDNLVKAAASFVAAVAMTAMFVSAAVPVMPIA